MNREQLERPFAPAQIRQRKGRNGLLDYVEGHSVIHRLNEALEGAWSFEIVHHEIREEEVLVLGKLTAEGITKMQFGASQVTRERESGALVSLGDDLKAALDRELVGTLDLIERDGEGRVVVVDLKTSSRKYTDLRVDLSLQLSVYSYATAMNGLADQEDLRLRFDVLTKTKQPELCRYWTQRDRAASVRLFRLVAEVLYAIEAGVFHPNVGWQCKDCQFRSQCWAWR